MTTNDTCCSIVPYFRAKPGKLEACQDLCRRFVEKTKSEPGCLYYGFLFDGDLIHCREGYVNGEAALAHLDNVSALLGEGQAIMDLERLEIHGIESEIAKMRGPMAPLSPQFFTQKVGFRK